MDGCFEIPAVGPDESRWDDDDDGNDDQEDETTLFLSGSASTSGPSGEQIEIKTMRAICTWNFLCWDIFWWKRKNNRGCWKKTVRFKNRHSTRVAWHDKYWCSLKPFQLRGTEKRNPEIKRFHTKKLPPSRLRGHKIFIQKTNRYCCGGAEGWWDQDSLRWRQRFVRWTRK